MHYACMFWAELIVGCVDEKMFTVNTLSLAFLRDDNWYQFTIFLSIATSQTIGMLWKRVSEPDYSHCMLQANKCKKYIHQLILVLRVHILVDNWLPTLYFSN